MADIRTAPQIDDFERPDESPLQPPWFRADSSWTTMALVTGGMQGNPGDSVYYHSAGSFDGDVEVWGVTGAGVDLTEAWRIGLLTDVGGSSAVDGYLLLVIAGGGAEWQLRKYTNFGFTTMATAVTAIPNFGHLILVRTTGADVEAWFSTDDGANWSLIVSATDSTYRTALRLSLGVSSDDGGNPSWVAAGGGAEEDFTPQIWRKRRKHGSR